MVTILVPSATSHRERGTYYEPCEGVTETLLSSQQLNTSGKPMTPGNFCIICTRFRSADKTFWTKMRPQTSSKGGDELCLSRLEYEYIVEGWCNMDMEQSSRTRLWCEDMWEEECHVCGDHSWPRMCPECWVRGWGAFIHHKDARCAWHQLKEVEFRPHLRKCSNAFDPMKPRMLAYNDLS